MRAIGRFLDHYDRAIKAVCLVIGVLGVLIGTSATLTNNQQQADFRAEQARRNSENAAVLSAQQTLLDCFDAYAAASSSSSKAVRVASVAKDEATAEFNRTLNVEGLAFKRLIGGILDESTTPADVRNLYDTLDARAKAGRQLDHAQDALDKARAENPIPDPPSEFCGSSD